MIIKFECPGCGMAMDGEAGLEFQEVTCPGCQNVFFPKPLKTILEKPFPPEVQASRPADPAWVSDEGGRLKQVLAVSPTPAATVDQRRFTLPIAVAAFALGLLALYLAAYSRPAPAPQTFEYSEFEFEPAEYPDFDPTNAEVPYVTFSDGDFNWSAKKRVDNVADVLNAAGHYGWRFTWGDGTNFIMERPANVWTNGNFFVARMLIPR